MYHFNYTNYNLFNVNCTSFNKIYGLRGKPYIVYILYIYCILPRYKSRKMRTAIVFKGHSLRQSIVSKKCTVAFAHAGWATRWALPRFLVF